MQSQQIFFVVVLLFPLIVKVRKKKRKKPQHLYNFVNENTSFFTNTFDFFIALS